MAPIQPVVLDVRSTAMFIEHILHHHAAPSTIIFCGTRDQLVGDLQQGLDDRHDEDPENLQTEPPDATEAVSLQARDSRSFRFAPTLRLLSSSRSIRVVFCPDVAHLRAYLAIYAVKILQRPKLLIPSPARGVSTLAILNFIDLHRETSAFSAQGLNRTFSLAVEAAYHSQSKLVVAECARRKVLDDDDFVPSDPSDSPARDNLSPAAPSFNPWDEAVSILNVTTKTFGVGARGWVGRTIQIRTIAERWFALESLAGHS